MHCSLGVEVAIIKKNLFYRMHKYYTCTKTSIKVEKTNINHSAYALAINSSLIPILYYVQEEFYYYHHHHHYHYHVLYARSLTVFLLHI